MTRRMISILSAHLRPFPTNRQPLCGSHSAQARGASGRVCPQWQPGSGRCWLPATRLQQTSSSSRTCRVSWTKGRCFSRSCVSNTERGMSSSESLSCWACWPEVFLWPRHYVLAALWKGWLVTFETFWQRIFRSLTGFLQVLLKSGPLGKRVPKLSLSLCCKGATTTKPAAPAQDFWISSQALGQDRLLGRARASDFGELTDAGAVVAFFLVMRFQTRFDRW